MKAPHAFRARRRAGLTLVEMLVAMVCTLLLMLAITQTFQSIGDVSQKGRAAIEISTQLRSAQNKLHKDLEALTVPVRPWPEAGAGEGYFEIFEGLRSDASFTPATGDTADNRVDVYGDVDDIIAFTVRSTGEPFIGRFNGATIQSQLAEVIWFTTVDDRDNDGVFNPKLGDRINLHRRVLLIRPDLNGPNGDLPGNSSANLLNFWQLNDVSVHVSEPSGTGNLVANNLSDLTLRQNRFAHAQAAANYPNALLINNDGFLLRESPAQNPTTPGIKLIGARTGEDVILSNIMAADVRVFDRQAQLRMAADGVDALSPGDPGYAAALANGNALVGMGAYVDLFYSRYTTGVTSEFANPHAQSSLGAVGIYDTWSYSYETDGIDNDKDGQIDEGADGLDNDNQNGVDDVGERETTPPYPWPLRSIQFRIRVLEPQTRQVRQATVMQDFIPE